MRLSLADRLRSLFRQRPKPPRSDLVYVDGSPQYTQGNLEDIAALIGRAAGVARVTLIGSRNPRNPFHGPRPSSDYDLVVELTGADVSSDARRKVEQGLCDVLTQAGYFAPLDPPLGESPMGRLSLLVVPQTELAAQMADPATLDVVAQAVRDYGQTLWTAPRAAAGDGFAAASASPKLNLDGG